MLITDPTYSAQMTFDIIQNGWHRPFVKGKCNRDMIEDQITIGILSGELQPMDQEDVDMVISLVDSLIESGKEKEIK